MEECTWSVWRDATFRAADDLVARAIRGETIVAIRENFGECWFGRTFGLQRSQLPLERVHGVPVGRRQGRSEDVSPGVDR